MTESLLREAAQKLKGISGAELFASVMSIHPGKVALVSSFGTESAVLLHMAAQKDLDIPVIFLDTGKLFGPTKSYKKKLVEHLGLSNVCTIEPNKELLDKKDSSGALWSTNPDECCRIRKVEPLAQALRGFDAWITGRKSFQNVQRTRAEPVEIQDERLVVSPLLNWQKSDLDRYFEEHALPRHPLEKEGYRSVGCFTCTTPVADDEDVRAGRWRGRSKTECGIHQTTKTRVS